MTASARAEVPRRRGVGNVSSSPQLLTAWAGAALAFDRRQFTGAIRAQTPEELERVRAQRGLQGLDGAAPGP